MLNSVKQAARKLGINTSLAYVLVQRGHLGSHKIGTGRGVYRISDTQIEAYLESTRQDAVPRRPGVVSGLGCKEPL